MISRLTLTLALAATAGAIDAGAQTVVDAARDAARQTSFPAPPVRLTLDDAIARGLETSHRLAEFEARGEGAGAAVAAELAADRPLLTILAGYTRTNHVDEFGVRSANGTLQVIYPDVPDNYRSRLDLQWPIYAGGRPEALVAAARAEQTAAGRDLETARADLRLEITRAYWALVTARETEAVVGDGLTRVDAHLADVRNRLDAGLIPPSDVLSVEAQRSRQQMLLIDAANQRELAAADLRRLTGLAPDAPLELASTLSEPPPPPSVDGLLAEAARARPERDALASRVDAARARGRAASAGRLPAVSLAAGYDYARPNPDIFPRRERWRDSWDVGVNVSWWLWDGGRVGAGVAEATAAERAAAERLAEFDDVLALEVRQQRLDLESRLASIAAAADGVRSAAEARRVATDRFDAGVATSTEVLDAQVALLSAELDRTRALAAARLAEARLARAVGR